MSVQRPTFSESWYRVAQLKPRLRSSLQVVRQHYRGQRWHVIHDRGNNQNFRLDEAGYHFVGLLDGQRSVEEAWQSCMDSYGDRAPTQGEAINILGQLFTTNLLQSDLPPDALGMFKRYRKRKTREITSFFQNILFMRVPVYDPDELLNVLVKPFGWIFGWVGFILWLILLSFGIFTLTSDFDTFMSQSKPELMLDPANLFLLYTSFAIIKAIHELGHGLACKHFGRMNSVKGMGGEVHTVGIMMLVFTPVPYVDASSSWVFRSKWHRAFVGAAGMYVELAVASVAAMVWANSTGITKEIAHNVMFIASVSTLLFNANPLLRFDGYYIMSDLLEMPNLAQRSKDYLYYTVKRYVFNVKSATHTARSLSERIFFLIYAIASSIYRVWISFNIILFVSGRFFFVGAIFAIVAVFGMVVMPVFKYLKYLIASPDLLRSRNRAIWSSLAGAGVIFILIGILPAPDRFVAQGVVEPVTVNRIYAPYEGFVGKVMPTYEHVQDLENPLIQLENKDLAAEAAGLKLELDLLEIQRKQAVVSEPALVISLDESIQAVQERLHETQTRLKSLRVKSENHGWWISPEAHKLPGAFVQQGQEMGMVVSLDHLFIRVVADQADGPRIEPEIGLGEEVELRLRGRTDEPVEATIEKIFQSGQEELPSAALGYLAGGQVEVDPNSETGTKTRDPFFEIKLNWPDAVKWQDRLSGQRVWIRFDTGSKPLAVQWWRSLRRLLQHRIEL